MKKYSTLLFFLLIIERYIHRMELKNIYLFIYFRYFFLTRWRGVEDFQILSNKTRDLSRVYDHVEEKVIIAIALASLHLKKDHVIGRDTPRWTIYFLLE